MAFYKNQLNQIGAEPMYYNNGYGYSYDRGYNNLNYRSNTLPGKFIRDPREIRPNDIPANGAVAFFPEENYNYIIAKGWNDSGDRMDVVKYVPEQRQNQEPQMTPEMQLLQATMQRLDHIEQMLVSSGLFVEEKSETKEEQEKKA